MAKLIHAATLADIKLLSSLYTTGANADYTAEAKKALMFTNDGYIVARGHEYYIGNTASGPGEGTPGINIVNGVISVVDPNGNQIGQTATLPVYAADRGLSITTGSVGHSNTAIANDTKVGASLSSYLITTKIGTFDTYGHLKSTTSETATHIDYITDALATKNKTYYLLFGENSTANTTYYQPLKSAGLYLQTSNANDYVTSLYVGGNIYAGGSDAANKVITAGDIGSLTGAMRFKGVANNTGSWVNGGTGPATHSQGDTYYVQTAGTYAGQICEVGDMLICITDGTSASSAHWTVVQNNWNISVPSTVPTIGTSETPLATVGGVTIKAKVASDNNTWRNIYVEGGDSQKVGTGVTTKAMNFVGGTGLTGSFLAAGTDTSQSGSADYFTVKFDLNVASTTEIGGVKVYAVDNSYTVTPRTKSLSANITANSYNKDYGYFGLQLDSNNAAFVHIPCSVANSTESNRVFGLVSSSSNVTSTSGYSAAPIINGLIYTPNIGKLMGTSAIGGGTQPIYWTGSAFANTTYTLGKSVPADAVFTDTNTWRPVLVYKIESNQQDGTIDSLLELTTTGTIPLKFSSNFTNNSNDEIDLVWAEVVVNNNVASITYSV